MVKSKNQKCTKFIFWVHFLYLPNVFLHEPNEFIHVRVVNKLSKFKFTIQRLSGLVLTYSVGKGDFQIILPSGWKFALYCFFFCVYCVLTDHLAECERFKYFQSTKWSKVKIKSVPSSFFGLPFLYLPNVLIYEPNKFIHVRVVNKLSKFQFISSEII